MVSMIRPKGGLVVELIEYCIYVLGFLFVTVLPFSLSYEVFLFACAVGGLSGGKFMNGGGFLVYLLY